MSEYLYPWNPFQDDDDARITGELASVPGGTRVLVVPRAAPFFSENLTIVNSDTNVPLVLGEDYVFSYPFMDFIKNYSKNVYGGIILLKATTALNISISYDTIGGPFVLDDVAYAEAVANIIASGRLADWSQVVNLPSGFPADPHDHPESQTYNYNAFMANLTLLIEAMNNETNNPTVQTQLTQHSADNLRIAHPNGEPDDVGLGNLHDYPVAQESDFDGNSNQLYMVLGITKKLIDKMLAEFLNGSLPADFEETVQEIYDQMNSYLQQTATLAGQVDNKLSNTINGLETFDNGATLKSTKDMLFHTPTNSWYYWGGTYPTGGYVVSGGASPYDASGNLIAGWKVAGAVELETRLSSKTIGLGGDIVGYTAVAGAIARTVNDRLRDTISVRDYYQSSDNGNWALAYNRAKAVNPKVWFPRSNSAYIVTSTLALSAGGGIYSNGATISSPPAADATGTALIKVISATSVSDIELNGITIDGGVNEALTSKNYTRPVQMTGCTNIRFRNVRIVNNPDWSFSLESCKQIIIDNYYQRSFVYANSATTTSLAGGRDGGHLMDCVDATLTNLDIESGDDCIGITSKLSGCANITVRGLKGSSVIASLLIYNEEQDASLNYYSQPCSRLKFSEIHVKDGANCRNIVRVKKYGSTSVINDVSITGVSGKANNSYGVWVGGVNNVYLNDINVESTQVHGAYIENCSRVRGNVKAKANVSTYHGVIVYNSNNCDLILDSDQSAGYGIYLDTVSYSVIKPYSYNCGAGLFSTSAGGGCRMVNCTNVNLPEGNLYGTTTVSYYGLNYSTGNTGCTFGLDLMFYGLVPSTRLPTAYYLKTPAVSLKFKEDSAGTLSVYSNIGCTLTRNAAGNYTVAFSSNMNSTGFQWVLEAYHNGARRTVQLSSAVTVGGFSFLTQDAAGTTTYADHVSLVAWNT